MERDISRLGFQSVAIFQPAAIYPGNDNTPNAFGAFNQSLNWLLPGAYNTVGSEEIGRAMMKTMNNQVNGNIVGVQVICGGADIRTISF